MDFLNENIVNNIEIDEDINVLDFIHSNNISDETHKENKDKEDIIVGIDLGTTN
jgi:hypothetical protein